MGMWKAFNGTNVEHACVAAAIQMLATLIVWLLGGLTWVSYGLCAVLGIMLFIGREHAQAEKKLQTKDKSDTITWKHTIDALKVWEWNDDSKLDLFCPVIGNVVLFIVGCLIFY